MIKNKIVTLNDLSNIRKKYLNKKIVLVHGVFDIVHKGHIEYFREAKKFGDILIASVTDDQYVNKGVNRPYFNSIDRVKLLSEFELINFVLLSHSKSAVEIISLLKPNYYVKGPDYLKNKMIKLVILK